MDDPRSPLGSDGSIDAITAAFDGSPEAVVLSTADGLTVYVNRSLSALFGYDDPAEMIGRPGTDFAAPEGRELILDNRRRRRRGEMPPRWFRSVGQRRDGSRFDAELHQIGMRLDGVDHNLVLVRDISKEQRDEDERRDREEFYRAMFEVNTAIKLLIDPVDGSIIDANPAAAEFYGWPLEQLRCMKIPDINTLSPEEIAREMELARTQKRMAFRFKHRTADGGLRDVDIYSGPVVLRGRQLLLSIIHDVTERLQLEDQLRRAHRLDGIGRLAAGIAHDFNNLLTVVLASAQIADRQLTPEHRVRAFLGDIRHAAQRGAELTRQLLAFARQQALAPASIELTSALVRITSLLERVLGDEIEVVAVIPDLLPRVRFDPGQLELAIINIALNARDAMANGGKLTLRATVDGRRVELSIEDTGCGMDAETRARAFEPFFTTKPGGQGTGLGLATVYGIVSQSGGEIELDSAPGRGTRVRLWLPIDTPVPGTPVAELVAAAPSAVRKIVLVDDRTDVLDALARGLTDVGLIVHTAASARAALATLDALGGDVDAVLSDVAMPERSGLELAADVRARWPGVPVVLMSGNARPADAAAVAAFLDKPFTIPDAIAALDRVVRPR